MFIGFYISAYSSLTSGRVAYAGNQLGTTFVLVFAGLSPSVDIYGPLWRIWGILLGTVLVAIVVLVLWPEYAGDSLLPRVRRVIRDTLALTPDGAASKTEEQIHTTNSGTMQVLAEMLQVADDAELEGHASLVDPSAVVEAGGTLRRIANRLASVATGRIGCRLPRLDPITESDRELVFVEICRQLQSWLDFFSGIEALNVRAARATALTIQTENLSTSVERFALRLEERGFGRIGEWTLEQRRTILAELQSMRRLEYLLSELNRWLAKIPDSPRTALGRL